MENEENKKKRIWNKICPKCKERVTSNTEQYYCMRCGCHMIKEVIYVPKHRTEEE
jgi:rRNA maturation endonuclease Nob1